MSSFLRVDAAVNAGTSDANWGCSSHPMQAKQGLPPVPIGTYVVPGYTATVHLNGQNVIVQIPQRVLRSTPGFGDAGQHSPDGRVGAPQMPPPSSAGNSGFVAGFGDSAEPAALSPQQVQHQALAEKLAEEGKAGPVRFELEPRQGAVWSNSDFQLSYKAWSADILCNALLEPDVDEHGRAREQDGSFVMFIAPPGKAADAVAPRDVVFLIDNSYSMSGSAMRNAVSSLEQCLEMLGPHDRFALGVFNHETQWWNGRDDMYHPDRDGNQDRGTFHNGKELVRRAHSFVGSIKPNGGTDIMSPVTTSLDMLASLEMPTEDRAGSSRVPIVFLITDGAVGNDKRIC